MSGDRKYIRNLGNTTLTVLITIPLMTAMYFFAWYPELNRMLAQVTQDIVVSIPPILSIQLSDIAALATSQIPSSDTVSKT